MAVVKLSSKEKGCKSVLFFTDAGEAYVTSASFLRSLLDHKLATPIILLTRLPISVDPSRFKKSPVFRSGGDEVYDKEKGVHYDGLGDMRKKKESMVKQYSDKVVE